MKIKKEDLIKMIESIPYDYVGYARIRFQNFEINEGDDEFSLEID